MVFVIFLIPTLMFALWCFLTLWCLLMMFLAHALMFLWRLWQIDVFHEVYLYNTWYFSWCFNTLVAVNISTEKYSLCEHHVLRLLTCKFKWREHIRGVINLDHNLKVTYDYKIFVNWHQIENINPKNIIMVKP